MKLTHLQALLEHGLALGQHAFVEEQIALALRRARVAVQGRHQLHARDRIEGTMEGPIGETG